MKGCVYLPHSRRAMIAALVLDSGAAIEEAQDLLDYKHITMTQIYDKRRRSVRDCQATRCRSSLWTTFVYNLRECMDGLGPGVLGYRFGAESR